MIHTKTFVNSNTASGYDGVSNSLIIHLVNGVIVDLGLCTAIGTFYANSETSFSGFYSRTTEEIIYMFKDTCLNNETVGSYMEVPI